MAPISAPPFRCSGMPKFHSATAPLRGRMIPCSGMPKFHSATAPLRGRMIPEADPLRCGPLHQAYTGDSRSFEVVVSALSIDAPQISDSCQRLPKLLRGGTRGGLPISPCCAENDCCTKGDTLTKTLNKCFFSKTHFYFISFFLFSSTL